MSKQEQEKHDGDQVMIKSTEIVQSLLKGLVVIQAFDQQRPTMTLSEVASETGYTRAAARRFLLTLVSEGYAKQEGKKFSLTAKILKLGFSYLASQDVWQSAQPLTQQLVEQLNESCSAAVLDGEEVVYVGRVATTKRIMSVSLNVGTRLPAFATSLGRVLLADMKDEVLHDFVASCRIEQFTAFTLTNKVELAAEISRVNQQGYSLVEQELELGLTSISVPVRNQAGKVLGALSISTHISQTTKQQVLTTILPALKACGAAIEQLTY